MELSPDAATHRWIDQATDRPHGRAVMWLRGLARTVMTDFDANGWLGTHDLWVLGTEQWRELIGGRPGGRLLDIGAGNGTVTAELAPLFDEVVTTELSRPMARRLRRRGWACHRIDIAENALPDTRPFDAVSLLNLIDRTNRPRTLLRRAGALVRRRGWILVAVPLPLAPHVDVGGQTVDADEPLPEASGAWEDAAGVLAARLIAPTGWHLEALARAPYLSRGDVHAPVMSLDDAIFACRAP